jgi:uncharacterized protein YbjT (DUF2867 family)
MFSEIAMSADLHVVLGATGGVGRSLVETLSSQGRQVRAVSRTVPNKPFNELPAPVKTKTLGLAAMKIGATIDWMSKS